MQAATFVANCSKTAASSNMDKVTQGKH